jgi:hypothetical protein
MTHHLNWLQGQALPKDGCRLFVACDSGQLSGQRGVRLDPLELFLYWQIHQTTLIDFFHRENHDDVSLDLIGPRPVYFADLCNRLSIYRQNRSCP